MGGSAGFDKIEFRNGSILLFTKNFDMGIWRELLSEYKGKLFLSAGNTPYATLKISGKNGVTDEILDLLKKYIQIKGEQENKNLV